MTSRITCDCIPCGSPTCGYERELVSAVERERDEAREKLAKAESHVKEVEQSCLSHFLREHLEGDGPEIDRWRARGKALEAQVARLREELDNTGCVECRSN